MTELIRLSTPVLAEFLEEKLPVLRQDWWQELVVERLSYAQLRFVEDQDISSLRQLDFAALLRVFDQNWHELFTSSNLPRNARGWVKELQTVRNKWAHLSSEAIPPSEAYRDTDTLLRLLAGPGKRPNFGVSRDS